MHTHILLWIEDPVNMSTREEQIHKMVEIRDLLRRDNSQVKIVADEWAGGLEYIKQFVKEQVHLMLTKSRLLTWADSIQRLKQSHTAKAGELGPTWEGARRRQKDRPKYAHMLHSLLGRIYCWPSQVWAAQRLKLCSMRCSAPYP